MARAPREQTIEVFPEADRLGDFPHPRFTESLYGHLQAEAHLAAGLAAGTLHHAWLLTGPQGIGKATLAYRFARTALAATASPDGLFAAPERLEPDPASQASHLVRALSHPDLLVIRRPYDIKAKRFKTAITVDEVRRLRDFLGHKQTGAGWKIVIVDAADELNINAANALLKSLEEPPARVIFLLVSATPGRLLTTIRSRCRVLNLKPLADPDVKRAADDAIAAAGMAMPDDNQWPVLLQAADGSVGRLLGLASDEGVQIAAKVDAVMGNLQRTNWSQIHQLADEFSSIAAADKFETFTDLVLTRLARLIRAGATGEGTAGDLEMTRKLGVQSDLASWAELWETLVREKAIQGTLNLDRKAFILDLVLCLGKLAKR